MPKGRAAPLPRTAQSRKPASGARSQSVKGLCKACWTTGTQLARSQGWKDASIYEYVKQALAFLVSCADQSAHL